MRSGVARNLLDTFTRYGLSLPAVGAFALGGASWPGYLLGLLTLAYLCWRHRFDGLGRDRLLRSTLLVAVFVGLARSAAPAGESAAIADPVLGVTGLLLLALVNAEPVLARALGQGRLKTANLAVVRPASDGWRNPRRAYFVHTLLMVYFGKTAASGSPAWPLLVGTLLVAGYAAVVVRYAWRQRRGGQPYHRDEAVWQALLGYAPAYAIHFSAPAGTEYHVGMWLPYLERLELPYLVILREERCLPAMAALTSAPIVVAPSMAELEHAVPPSLRACFYVNNAMRNAQMVRFLQLTHIQLLHGDSDKSSSYNPVTAMFDEIFVAGQAGIDRYAENNVRIPREKFTVVGRPQVSELRIADRPVAEVAAPTVLYAPTWTGWFTSTNYCSLPIGERIVRGLLDRGATVICRPHPYTRRNPASARQLARVERLLAEDAAATGRRHVWGAAATTERSLFDCMNAADAMLSDVSAVASDWLYSEKPFAITDMLGEGERFADGFPLARAAYPVDADGGNLPEVLDQLLGADPLAAVRREMKSYYLGDFPADRYADGFVDAARRCVYGDAVPLRTPGVQHRATFRGSAASLL